MQSAHILTLLLCLLVTPMLRAESPNLAKLLVLSDDFVLKQGKDISKNHRGEPIESSEQEQIFLVHKETGTTAFVRIIQNGGFIDKSFSNIPSKSLRLKLQDILQALYESEHKTPSVSSTQSEMLIPESIGQPTETEISTQNYSSQWVLPPHYDFFSQQYLYHLSFIVDEKPRIEAAKMVLLFNEGCISFEFLQKPNDIFESVLKAAEEIHIAKSFQSNATSGQYGANYFASRVLIPQPVAPQINHTQTTEPNFLEQYRRELGILILFFSILFFFLIPGKEDSE
jgi:hypothetical protein